MTLKLGSVIALLLIVICSKSSRANDPQAPSAHSNIVRDLTAPPENIPQSLRQVQGKWQPTVLPPNDLSDPPENYPRCFGGACVGMATVMQALCTNRIESGVLEVRHAAARVLRSMVMNPDGTIANHPLPSHLLIDGKTLPITNQEALVRLVEEVQTSVYPDGIPKQTPFEVRRSYHKTAGIGSRIDSHEELIEQLELAGGRLVVGMIHYNANLTEVDAHALILTLGRDGRIYVWDPNAKMTNDALGSGVPSPLTLHADQFGRIMAVSYQVDMPDGKQSRRDFEFLFPLRTFINEGMIPNDLGQIQPLNQDASTSAGM